MTLIACALTQGADIFVMDEPTNGLDYGNQIRLLERINQLAAEGLAFIYTRQPPKTPNSALRFLDEMLIYLCVNSASVSVASLDFGVFGGCHHSPSRPRDGRFEQGGYNEIR